jgi:hypothetical protein
VNPPTVGCVVSADGTACSVQLAPPSVVTQSSPSPGSAPPTATHSLDELHEMLSGPAEALPTTCCVHVDPPLAVFQIAPFLLVLVPTATQSLAEGHEIALSEAAPATLFGVHDPGGPPVPGLALALVVDVLVRGVPFPPDVVPDVREFAVEGEPQPARSSAIVSTGNSGAALRFGIISPSVLDCLPSIPMGGLSQT